MRLWWLLATRHWLASPGRAIAAVLSVGLGVGAVVAVTSFHETALSAIRHQVVDRWLGKAHLVVHPPDAHWGALDAAVVDQIEALPGVSHVTGRLSRRAHLLRWNAADSGRSVPPLSVQAIGVDPARADFSLTNLAGQLIVPGVSGVVMERVTAAECGVGLGGTVRLSKTFGGDPMALKVVGLFDGERIADFQSTILYLPLADLQRVFNEPGTVSAIYVTLDNPSAAAIDAAEVAIHRLVADRPDAFAYRVESAKSRQVLLDEAERLTKALLVLVAFVALLTSFFIIVTTMSMSLFERRTQLGVLRCIGATRPQLGNLIMIELLPLGAVGTAVGMVGGFATTSAVSWLIARRFDLLILSPWGLRLACLSGMLTVLVSAGLLMAQVCRVAPLTAVRTMAYSPRRSLPILSGLVGIALIIAHECAVSVSDQTLWLDPKLAFPGVIALYLGYILIAPALVVLIGRPIARVVGPLLGLSAKLAEDQFGKAPWRGAGVCWVLMVGLSLMVYLAISSQAVLAIWDFPSRLPESFVWSQEYVPGDLLEDVKKVPGVKRVTITTDVGCVIGSPDAEPKSATGSLMKMLREKLLRPVFVAADPDEIMAIIKVAFIEGSYEDAVEKLNRGGYVMLPVQTSRNKNLHVGDKVKITIGRRSAVFEIAGVVQSPAMDIAVTAFQATSYMQIAAASAVLGTQQDLRDKFGIDRISMFMFDLDLPEVPVPPDFDPNHLPPLGDRSAVIDAMIRWAPHLPNETDAMQRVLPMVTAWREGDRSQSLSHEAAFAAARLEKAIQRVHWSPNRDEISREEAWSILRERLVMVHVAQTINRPGAVLGSLSRLRRQLEDALLTATSVLTFLPTVLLLVAAVGIGNLMMVNVQIRARQLAVLRAVGALKSQIVRLVLAEAITLSLIGSVTGVALGVHEAYSRNRLVMGITGMQLEFIMPYGAIAVGVGVTVLICLLAGIGPARFAARNNIVEAMQVS